MQVGILRIVLVVAAHIEQRVVGTEAHDSVDMSVGVIADELSVVEPYYLTSAETFLQHLLHLSLCHGLVTVGCHKAYACGEHRAASVALYRTTLEHEVVVVDTFATEHATSVKRAVDEVVLVGSELLAPSVEAEVEQATGDYGILAVVTHRLLGWCSRDCCTPYVNAVVSCPLLGWCSRDCCTPYVNTVASCCRDERDEGVVACPSVVVVALVDAHVLHLLGRKTLLKFFTHRVWMLCGDDKRLVMSHSLGYLHESFGDVVEVRKPVGILVRPCELHARLAMPLGRKYIVFVLHKI